MKFHLLVLAETTKVFSRLSAKVGLLVSVGIGACLPLLLWLFVNSGMIVNGVESDEFFAANATDGIGWSLSARNFMLVRAFLVVLGAQTFAGELSARTLREALLRPVPRDLVVFAKWLALIVWDAVSLGLTWVTAAVLGSLLLGVDGVWVDVTLATFVNLLCDAGVIAVVFAVGVVTKSTVATIAGMIVALVLDKLLGMAMVIAAGIAGALETTPIIVTVLNSWPILPSAAFGLWAGMLPDGVVDARSVASLLILTAGGLLATMLRLRRMEVP